MIIRSLSLNDFYTNFKAKVKTSKTDKSTCPASELKNTSSLPNSVVQKIQDMAKDGASKGVYMGDDYLFYINSYKKQHVSPNRLKLISLLAPRLINARYTNFLPSIFKISGLPFIGQMSDGLFGPSMFIYDENGDEVLSYSSNAGWVAGHTRAEDQFYAETKAIYYKAYKSERAEMKASSAQNCFTTGNCKFDMKA